MIRPSGKLNRFMSNAEYQVSAKRTKEKESRLLAAGTAKRCASAFNCGMRPHGADHTLLPLHLSFCRTTLKNDASGKEASGSVFLALRMVTIDPRSTWIGLRPSSVRYTG